LDFSAFNRRNGSFIHPIHLNCSTKFYGSQSSQNTAFEEESEEGKYETF